MYERPSLMDVLEHYGYSPRKVMSCAFHDESHPSMSCDFEKDVYFCHSCGAKGDSWTFIMEKEGVKFDGATRFAGAHGLSAQESGTGDESLRVGLSGRGRGVRSGKGSHPRNRRWVPPWGSSRS